VLARLAPATPQWYKAAMRDSPGFFMPYAYALPTRWSHLLSQNAGLPAFRQYTRYKFVVYDHAEEAAVDEKNVAQLAAALTTGRNTAYIHPSSLVPSREIIFSSAGTAPMPLMGDAPDFQVTHFDVNSLAVTTRFSQKKFLVYNDSYSTAWQAFLNGKKIELQRANVAFKGLWLPPGKNDVVLRYHPWGGQGLYFGMIGLFMGMWIWLLWLIPQTRWEK
jgi:hypothetical protein